MEARNQFDSFNFFDLFDEGFEMGRIIDIQYNRPFKSPCYRGNGDGLDINLQLFRDNVRDIAYDTNTVYPGKFDANRESADLFQLVGSPFGPDDSISVIGHQSDAVRAVGAMDFDSVIYRNKPENIVSRDSIAALGKGIVHVQVCSTNNYFRRRYFRVYYDK